MDETTDAVAVPVVTVQLEVSPELHGRARMESVAVSAVAKVVADILKKLGIPGRCDVTWQPNDQLRGSRPLAIYANGRPCRYSDELMVLLYSYVLGKVARPLDSLSELPEWLTGGDEHLVAEWVTLLCGQALTQHAGILLGREQARAYCKSLATNGATYDDAYLAPVLARVLDLGISLSDHGSVTEAIGDNPVEDDLYESLVSLLRSNSIEVRMERSYLRRLTLAEGARGPELFTFLRDGLYAELGVEYPSFQIVPDATLRPGGFVFSVNHVSGAPLIGLPEDRILVNDVPDRLRPMGFTTEPALNPATYQTNGIASREDKDRLEAAKLTTWDAFQFLILSLAAELRAKNARLVERSMAAQMLSQIESAFPELVRASNEHIPVDQLTAILRGLAADQVSLRNLRRILELLLECELFVHPGASVAERISYVKSGLADAIAYKYTRGGSALVVYLLDVAAEQAIAEGNDLGNLGLAPAIVRAIRAELRNLPSNAVWPILLVGDAVCASLQKMIADELPRMRVLSYSQLPPDLNVQPVARIELHHGVEVSP